MFVSKQYSIVMFFGWMMLFGCQSTVSESPLPTAPTQLSYLPHGAKTTGPDIIDVQLTLADRNLYLSNTGSVRHLTTEHCAIDIGAHRGDFRQPESSAEAIIGATKDNYSSVEIDVMLLKDGIWVNHHDQYSGRATVHYTGQRYAIEQMSRKTFSNLKLRDKKNHDLLDIRPISAAEAFRAFANSRQPRQQLNVEVKSHATGQALNDLDDMLRRIVGQGAFYYSSLNREVLQKLRGINSDVYLGFIQGPHPRSVQQLKSNLRRGVKNDRLYAKHHTEIEGVGRYGSKRYSKKYRNYTSAKALNSLHQDFGRNSGLHLDIRSYQQYTGLLARAHHLGMKIHTYSINGSLYHQRRLLKLKRQRLPDGAIVDTTPYRLCQRLFELSVAATRYQPMSKTGKYLASLPNDADFDRLDEMLSYQQEGYYIALTSELKSIAGEEEKPQFEQSIMLVFPQIIDQKIERPIKAAIKIKLGDKNHGK